MHRPRAPESRALSQPPRSFDHRDFCVDDLLRREQRVCVLLPAREEAASIGAIVDVLAGLRERGAIDELLVIDGRSADGTGAIAAERGATVLQRDELLPAFGPVLGKGDAVWRGLSATDAEIVCVLDADLAGFDERFVVGLVAPLLAHPELVLVKGSFERPYRASDGTLAAAEGGRVTELLARPLLRVWHPSLAGFEQPLSGQWAARGALLRRLSFWTGYALEICMLLEAAEQAGVDALAQSHLGTLLNRHQSLRELGAMAHEVLLGVAQRQARQGGPEAAPADAPAGGAGERVVRRLPLAELAVEQSQDAAAAARGGR